MTTADDRLDIIELTARYCWGLDTKQFDLFDQVFTDDATASLRSKPLVGRDAIVARLRRAMEPWDATHHLIGNHTIVFAADGDHATCRTYLTAQHVRLAAAEAHGISPNYTIAGWYLDDVVRTPAGWRIAHRELIEVWNEGDPRILTFGR